MRREPDPSLPTLLGSGCGDSGNLANTNMETQIRDNNDDEEAEGAKVQLAKVRKTPSNLDQHVVYPDPTLLIAAEPTAGRVRGDNVVATHGAHNFMSALHSYLKAHKTWHYIDKNFLPTLYHYFPVWYRLYLQHKPLPFDLECVKHNMVCARPHAAHRDKAFDVVLVRYREDVFGLDGFRAIHIRVIFSLPPDLAWLCPHPLIYADLFNPFSTTVNSFHRLNETSYTLLEGKRQSAIYSIHNIAATCHLAPNFRRLEPDVRLNTTRNLLKDCQYFYLNHYYNHHIFGLIGHWRSLRAVKYQNLLTTYTSLDSVSALPRLEREGHTTATASTSTRTFLTGSSSRCPLTDEEVKPTPCYESPPQPKKSLVPPPGRQSTSVP
ncbi:hypothetical protein BDV93DRAFT_565329 [Ceratobasidium sp. AG-I]|nr:hypothetical protein BDV93DRAFT_565329 [Ceratobasidium sp. AG-I]